MSKVKAPKIKGVPNKHLHARTSFLYQAATYLTLQTSTNIAKNTFAPEATQATQPNQSHQNISPLALQLGSDLQQVSRKGQLRLSRDLKRSLCKTCNTVLIPGRTATQIIENQSKHGAKPWADVLVICCNFCTSTKRFPVGAKRQHKKCKRKIAETGTTSAAETEVAAKSELAGGTDDMEISSNTG